MMIAKTTWKTTLHALVYLLPALVVLGVFSIYPIFQLIDLSFQTDYNFFNSAVYARGWDNYIQVLHDPRFSKAVTNTLWFACVVVPLKLMLSLGVALLLNRPMRFGRWFRAIYILPLVTSVVALSLVWRLLFHSEYGLINELLNGIGIQPIGWLTQPGWSLWSVMIFHIWKDTGYYVLFFLAGLQKVSHEYALAAQVDGANRWQKLRYVTLPLLAPTIRFIFVLASIEAFKVFDEVFTLYGNSPGSMDSAITVVYYIFTEFYQQSAYSKASAAACLLLALIAGVTWVQMKLGKKSLNH